MTDGPTELTIENSARVLIDHQPWVAFSCEVDGTHLINSATSIAGQYVFAQVSAGLVEAPNGALASS